MDLTYTAYCRSFFTDPARGHVYMLNGDVSNNFYQIGLRPAEARKVGLIISVDDGKKLLDATPLTLPMGWKNLPPLFFTATETVDDLVNQALWEHTSLQHHKLDNRAASVVSAVAPTLDPTLVHLYQDTFLLCTNSQLLEYVDIFVDDLLGLAQGPTHQRCHVCRPLFHALYKVFRPLDNLDPNQRK